MTCWRVMARARLMLGCSLRRLMMWFGYLFCWRRLSGRLMYRLLDRMLLLWLRLLLILLRLLVMARLIVCWRAMNRLLRRYCRVPARILLRTCMLCRTLELLTMLRRRNALGLRRMRLMDFNGCLKLLLDPIRALLSLLRYNRTSLLVAWRFLI